MKRLFLLVFPMFFLLLRISAQTDDAVKQYIERYKEIAINEEIRTGIPAAITLAQGIFESMAGESDLAIASNNHFGIKCKDNWTGNKVYHDDDARNECFRSYATVEESYRDHSDFLKTRPNYAFLFSINPTDYKGWAFGLKKAGYATNPAYAYAIIKKIEDNDLQQYTLVALKHIADGTMADVAINNTSSTNKAINVSIKSAPGNNEPEQSPEAILEEYSGSDNYPKGTFTINKTKVVFVEAGASLFALASNNNISLEKLQDYNDLNNNVDILSRSQLIYLEKKPKKSNSKDFHIVGNSETIEVIAQKEGVQLESLFEYNKMQKGLQPAPGEKVYLKPGKQSFYPKLLPRSYAKVG
jgi:LysM repeat protein